jgi:hypothetical protein
MSTESNSGRVAVITGASSGLGTTPEDYARACKGARMSTGLAVRGEEVRSGSGRRWLPTSRTASRATSEALLRFATTTTASTR